MKQTDQAKRRVIGYGGRYDFTHHALDDAPPIPEFLQPLRGRTAAWAGIPPDDFHHAMIVEYRPGSALGWHRDVPDFEQIVGISLLGSPGSGRRMRSNLNRARSIG